MGHNDSSSYIDLARLLWAGPLTILASVAAVLCVRVLAVAVLQPPRTFQPLLWPPPIIDTVVGVGGAIIVFSLIATSSLHPVRTFRAVAAAVLVLSFIPDVLLATRHSFGGGWPEALALAAMHVVAWAVSVTLLINLASVQVDKRAGRAAGSV